MTPFADRRERGRGRSEHGALSNWGSLTLGRETSKRFTSAVSMTCTEDAAREAPEMAPARDFTRRHFLEGLAASSIAMPAIVPSSVLGRDDKAAPSERITVGLIGCGKMANDYHLHELLRFGDVQTLAVCEVDGRTRPPSQLLTPSTRSVPARWPSPSSATSPTGTAAIYAGTRPSGSLWTMPRPTAGSTASARSLAASGHLNRGGRGTLTRAIPGP